MGGGVRGYLGVPLRDLGVGILGDGVIWRSHGGFGGYFRGWGVF